MKSQDSSSSILFLELYSYKPAWWQLGETQRAEVAQKAIESLDKLSSLGVTVLGYGRNDAGTSQRAPYDFFAVYEVPDLATQQAFEEQVQSSGWYDLFEQVNLRGAVTPYADALLSHVTDLSRPGGGQAA